MIFSVVEIDKSKGVLIGLSRGNVERLMQSEPLIVDENHPAAKLLKQAFGFNRLLIMFGETESDIIAQLRKAGLPLSEEGW